MMLLCRFCLVFCTQKQPFFPQIGLVSFLFPCWAGVEDYDMEVT